jgi:hypothetical protein
VGYSEESWQRLQPALGLAKTDSMYGNLDNESPLIMMSLEKILDILLRLLKSFE